MVKFNVLKPQELLGFYTGEASAYRRVRVRVRSATPEPELARMSLGIALIGGATWGQPPQGKHMKSGLCPIEMRIFAPGFTRDWQLRNALW